MNYPVWDVTFIGGGTWIAFIAIIHVLISHFAVGGGFFLWFTDREAVKAHDADLLNYVRRHTSFFLLLTIVGGGMTGVGIWFIIALAHPAATSTLIHTYVFAWAIEWVFFVVEIVALLIYHYRFDILSQRNRLRIAFLYCLFAWLSLAAINGMLSFMLTPGRWVQTHDFWHGFFNPTYPASLCFRTAISLILAGVFGYLTAVRTRDEAFRQRLIAYCSKWILFPVVALVLSAAWYLLSLPEEIRRTSFLLNPQTTLFLTLFLATSGAIFIGGAVMMRRWSRGFQGITTGVLIALALTWIGSFEYVREISRKPFVISGYMYDSSIPVSTTGILDRDGVLSHANWTSLRTITVDNRAEAGREIFRLECQCCHTIGGVRNNIGIRIKDFTHLGIMACLTGQGTMLNYMPPFIGTHEEKQALAVYLTTEVNRKEIDEPPPPALTLIEDEALPPFDDRTTDYVLLAWNDLGMHCISDGDAWFSFLPPANTIEAQLIKRGDPPQIISSEVVLSYAVEPGFDKPSDHSRFWDYSEPLFGVTLQKNIGLFGKGTKGVLDLDSSGSSFIARGIPIVPYNDDGSYNPYPCVTLEARDAATGKLLVSTKLVAPVSAEIGCRNCHGGGWRYRSAGLSEETATNILTVHDRINGTSLLSLARSGKPQLCQSCHPDPVLKVPGKPGVLDFSTAMHAWHSLFVPFDDDRACGLCHPSAANGTTRCLRDLHASLGYGCIDCHGNMSQDARVLLEKEADKVPAQRLMALIRDSLSRKGNARIPWMQENDCLTCHQDFQPPQKAISGFGVWTGGPEDLYRFRTDIAGVRCPACHGSTHALYPTRNVLNRDRDNIQPLQYTASRTPIGGSHSCEVCHRRPMKDAIHHPNMEMPFRNRQLLK